MVTNEPAFLSFFEQTILHQVIVHADFSDLEGAHAGRNAFVLYIAFERESQDHQPVGITALATFLDGFVYLRFANRTEFRTNMNVSFLFSGYTLVKALGMEIFAV